MKQLLLAIVCYAVLSDAVGHAAAAPGRITRITKDVKVQGARIPRHSAKLNESIANGTSIEAGPGSQTELRFDDVALVRLGQNSSLYLKDTSQLELRRGAILVRAVKGNGMQIAMGNVVSVVDGTTSLLEYYPEAYAKLILLEGVARMFMPSVIGESVLVNAGQLLMFHTKPKPAGLPNPVDIDINRLLTTSQLIKGFAPLGSESSIAQGASDQKKQKSTGALADTNLVIFGRGTLVSLVPPGAETSVSPSPSPTHRHSSSSHR